MAPLFFVCLATLLLMHPPATVGRSASLFVRHKVFFLFLATSTVEINSSGRLFLLAPTGQPLQCLCTAVRAVSSRETARFTTRQLLQRQQHGVQICFLLKTTCFKLQWTSTNAADASFVLLAQDTIPIKPYDVVCTRLMHEQDTTWCFWKVSMWAYLGCGCISPPWELICLLLSCRRALNASDKEGGTERACNQYHLPSPHILRTCSLDNSQQHE